MNRVASSSDGIDLSFLAHCLENTSLSPRGVVINALDSDNLDEIVALLKENGIFKSSALELAACLYAILPKAADEPELFHDMLFRLANRLITNKACSYNSWNTFTALLESKPTPKQLSQFLFKDRSFDNDCVNEPFVRATWARLSKYLLPEPPYAPPTIPDWLLENPDVCLNTLLLIFCYSSRGDIEYNQESLIESQACMQFILQLILQIQDPTQAQELVNQLTDNDPLAFIESSNPDTCQVLACIYIKNTALDISLVHQLLRILESPKHDQTIEQLLSAPWTMQPIKLDDDQPVSSKMLELVKTLPQTSEKCLLLLLKGFCSFALESCNQLKRLSGNKNCSPRIEKSLLVKSQCIHALFSLYNSTQNKEELFEILKTTLMDTRTLITGQEPKVFHLSEAQVQQQVQQLIYCGESISFSNSSTL